MPMPSPPQAGFLFLPLLRRLSVELGPVLVFFGGFMWRGIMFGTAAFMAAAVLSVIVSLSEKRGLPAIPLVTAGIILMLGSLTLMLEQSAFIKMQPTAANGLFALAIGGGTVLGRDLLRRSFSPEIRLTGSGWRKLSLRAAAYLLALAVLNEFVWRSFSTETWVYFKTFGVLPANMAFACALIPLIRTHWLRP